MLIQINWFLLRSQLIWIYTVCKGRAYPGSAGPGLSFARNVFILQITDPQHHHRACTDISSTCSTQPGYLLNWRRKNDPASHWSNLSKTINYAVLWDGLSIKSHIKYVINQIPHCPHITTVYALRKQAYLNILNILWPKNGNFQIKNSDFFFISFWCPKHRLWVLVRSASTRRF